MNDVSDTDHEASVSEWWSGKPDGSLQGNGWEERSGAQPELGLCGAGMVEIRRACLEVEDLGSCLGCCN